MVSEEETPMARQTAESRGFLLLNTKFPCCGKRARMLPSEGQMVKWCECRGRKKQWMVHVVPASEEIQAKMGIPVKRAEWEKMAEWHPHGWKDEG